MRTLSPIDSIRFPSGNSMASCSRRIGTITLTEPDSFTKSYEVAAWSKTIACEPQTAVLWTNGYYVSWSFEGTVTNANFPTLFGGVQIGTNPSDARERGKPETYSVSTYAYAVAERIGTGDPMGKTAITLDAGYGVEVVGEFDAYDGTMRKHWGLTMPAAGHPLTVTWQSSAPHPVWSIRERQLNTYAVTYLDRDCGTVTVDTQRYSQEHHENHALRAAADLVFTAPAAAEVTA